MRLTAAATLMTLMLAPITTRGATIYRENFPSTSGMVALSTVGWTPLYGNAMTNATLATPGSTGNPANAMLSGGTSAPTPGANVNAGTSAQTTNGFAPLLSADGAQDFLIYTNEFAIDRTANLPATFQWYAASGYAGDAQRLAVRVGGNWYAKTTTFAPAVIGTSVQGVAGAQQVVQPFSTSGWVTINATVGSPLTLGMTTLALPDGVITAFGVYAELVDASGAMNERTFVDTFEVTTSPEPTTLAALAGVALLFTRRARR